MVKVKLPMLKNDQDLLMELQEIGVTPVSKNYCATCKYRIGSLRYPNCLTCKIKLGSCVNTNHDCIHWEKRNDHFVAGVIILPLVGFIIGLLF